MEIILINADKREKIGTKESKRLRKQNLIPAVLYGGKQDNELLMLMKKEASKLLGHSTRLIDLVFSSKTERVMVKELKYDSLTESITHIDFTRVAMDQIISVAIDIILKGIPKGAKEGGVLEQNLRSLSIECLPSAIPEKIDVDISNLELGSVIRVKDLILPAGVKTSIGADIVVAGVHAPKVEEVAAVLAEAAAEPEVLTAKKPEEEGEEKPAEKAHTAAKEKEPKK